jgi:hypothetical protein
VTGHFRDHWLNLVLRLLDCLLLLYPLHFRMEFSSEIHGVLVSRLWDVKKLSKSAWIAGILREVTGLIFSIWQEYWHEMRKKMNTPLEQNKPNREFNKLASLSFRLSLISILSILLMLVLLYSNFSPIPYVSLPLQLLLVIVLFSIPTLISLGSLVTGIRSLGPIRANNQKGSWMAIFGIVCGSLVFLSMGLLYRAILLDT